MYDFKLYHWNDGWNQILSRLGMTSIIHWIDWNSNSTQSSIKTFNLVEETATFKWLFYDTLNFKASLKKSPKGISIRNSTLWKFKRWAIIDKFKVNSSLEETMFRDLQRNFSRVSNPIIKIFNLSRCLKESFSSSYWLRCQHNR